MGISGTDKALMYSQFGVARFGATRFGYHSAKWFVTIGGVQRRGNVDQASITITDVLDEQPSRLRMTVVGVTPTVGQEVIFMLGSTDNRSRLFAGHILNVTTRYDGRLHNDVRDIAAVDYTWLLGKQVVTARYENQSASTIVADLIATYSAGVTTQRLASGLETLADITFTNEELPTALTRLAARIGGYWYLDYLKDLHFWVGDEANTAPPVAITTSHPSVNDFVHDNDLGAIVTRVFVEGRGSRILGAVAAGDTRIPLEAVDMFEALGEFAKVSFQGSEGGAQHLTFTGVVTGGGGSLVGPGVTPSAAPAGQRAAGTGVTAGTHLYGYTWATASGETLPGPTLSIATGFVDPPSSAPNAGVTITGSQDASAYYGVAVTFVTAAGETTAGPRLIWLSGAVTTGRQYNTIPTGPTGTTNRKLYRTEGQGSQAAAGTAQLKLLATIADNTTELYSDTTADASLGANVPTSNTATAEQIDLSAIAVGPSGTTARKLYRTVAAGAQLKLVATIAGNAATTYTDITADGSLGANAPTSDTSALTQPDGQGLPGDTSIVVASTVSFQSGGGWAIVGNGEQVIRYTGFSGGSLTGIPTSGIGAIVAAVAYNSTITATPMLTGIPASGAGAILTALTAGDEVYLVVQRDDATRQATLAALIGGGGDGIRETWVQDRRLSISEAQARGDAYLDLNGDQDGRITYRTRDKTTHAGRTITVTNFNGITGTFRVQEVVWTDFSESATRYPSGRVYASTKRRTFEDLLRLARKEQVG